MAVYEYRCRTCDDVFELRRSMSDANSPAICPDGHADTVRLLSMFATSSSLGSGSPAGASAGPPGGCCGGGCGCAR